MLGRPAGKDAHELETLEPSSASSPWNVIFTRLRFSSQAARTLVVAICHLDMPFGQIERPCHLDRLTFVVAPPESTSRAGKTPGAAEKSGERPP